MSDDLFDEIEEEAAAPVSAGPEEVGAVSRGGRQASDLERSLELLPLIVETIHVVKKRLRSAQDFTKLSQGKFSDTAFERYFSRALVEDLEKIDQALNGLLHYIRIQTPMRKKGTLERLVNRTIDALKGKVEEKGVKVFRRLEEGLPETVVPEGTLQYVLDVVLRYAASSVSTQGGIGISLKSAAEGRKGAGEALPSIGPRPYVEAVAVFTTKGKRPDQDREGFGRTAEGEGELLDLELRICQAIVEKYQGRLRLERDEKKGKVWLVLKLPVERRRVFQFRAA